MRNMINKVEKSMTGVTNPTLLSASWSSSETLNSLLSRNAKEENDDNESIWSLTSTLSSNEMDESEEQTPHYLSPQLRYSLSRRNIPIVQNKLKLGDIRSQKFQESLKNILASCFPDLDLENVSPQITRLSGAMTNCVYIVSIPSKSDSSENSFQAIMRVYGEATDNFIQRDHEMLWFCRMADLRVGPGLLAVFKNGRFEEYLDSDTLGKADLRNPETSEQIALAVEKLHSFERSSPSSRPILWSNLRSWLRLVWTECQERPDFLSRLHQTNISLPQLAVLIGEKETELETVGTIVFSHNDLQYGNILRLRQSNELILVDFEYSGYNYLEYDIANHFCEWAADYHCDTPHLMRFDRFPNVEEQTRFIKAYLLARKSRIISEVNSSDVDSLHEHDIQDLRDRIMKFVPCSHILWGLWGLYQAANADENIEFDYFGYALERLQQVL